MKTAVIINADDFGFSAGTNLAVQRLAELGTISSTSMMINMPFVEGIRQVLHSAPRLGVGLHLNLTQGRPLSPRERVRSLLDGDGSFLSPKALLRGSVLGRVSMEEVRREVGAQIEAARALVDGRLDHWDSHQGCHRFEPLASVFLSACKELGVPAMRCHRHWFASKESPGVLLKADLASLKRFRLRRVMVESYYGWLARRSARSFAMPSGLLTLLGEKSTGVFRYLVEHGTPSITLEVPCHPATTTDGLWGTRMLDERVEEYEYLASHEFREAVQDGRIRLLDFARLATRVERGRRHEELETTPV